jgi:FtsP/CotA-like multicopper oxidase with cupredoxin domain
MHMHPSRALHHLFAVTSVAIAVFGATGATAGTAQPSMKDARVCTRPAPGSPVPEPRDLRSSGGVLNVELALRDYRGSDGRLKYCYLLPDGSEAPTLRVRPGDLLIVRLSNHLADPGAPPPPRRPPATGAHDEMCTSGAMEPTATNLHFHGLALPPVCHQDEVMKTSIPSGGSFEYRFRVPSDQPPGLYWYHPHIHGFSMRAVLAGASGALVVEGLERAIPEVAGLPERVLVVRDQYLMNPDAPPSPSEPVTPQILLDPDGDTINTHTGYGKPAKDLSLNFVPVPYPDYPPAVLGLRPGERQLWRVVNASAITYLHLAVLFGATAQRLGVVAIDGVPISVSGPDAPHVEWVEHIGIPPGGRAEFIVTAPPAGVPASLITRSVDTGASGDNDPNRILATLVAAADAPEPRSALDAHPQPAPQRAGEWLGNLEPVRVRKLYFSEVHSDPADPRSPITYFITEQGKDPRPFDPAAAEPDIIVRQGDVEDWVIENRTTELHAFHIHQIHFLLLDWFGLPVREPFLRDTVNVPFYDPQMGRFPSVRVRMDFRDPNTVGTFLYHCHVLEHEDGGMMGVIRVEPRSVAHSPSGDQRSGSAPSAP